MPNLGLAGRLRTLSFESGRTLSDATSYGSTHSRTVSVEDSKSIVSPSNVCDDDVNRERSSSSFGGIEGLEGLFLKELKKRDPTSGRLVVVSLLFLFAGVAEVAVNRWLLWAKGFHFPLITTVWADLFAVVLLILSERCGIWRFEAGRGVGWKRRVVCLGVLSCLNSALDMYGLMLMPATLVKTIRTVKPLIAAGLLYVVDGTTQSFSKLVSLICVALGAACLTFKSDLGLNAIGTSCVFVATTVSATHFVLASLVMRENGVEPISLMGLVSIVSMIVLLPFAVWY